MEKPGEQLETLSRKLQQLHTLALEAERPFHPPMRQLEMLDRLLKDPAWAWLRPLSALIADIDHVLAQEQPPTEYDLAVVAAHARELLSGKGAASDSGFLDRYRALLQLSPELVSAHGELKGLLVRAPLESENEAERLHHRHQWAMRCGHRQRG
ncbi:MAG: hypothetical protein ACREV5_02230 [Steroidobacter sp.]